MLETISNGLLTDPRRLTDPVEHVNALRDRLDALGAFVSLAVVNHRRRHTRQPQIEFGLGLHLWTATHANVGSRSRLAFYVVGPAVNMTARIQTLKGQPSLTPPPPP